MRVGRRGVRAVSLAIVWTLLCGKEAVAVHKRIRVCVPLAGAQARLNERV
jgi:hypothetical protein